jgi:secreted trypsin-like serine protease
MMLTSSSSATGLASASLLHSASGNLFEKQPRIIGGAAVKSTRYPYTVALTTTGDNFFCGGTLIAKDVVLTAGEIECIMCFNSTKRIHLSHF